MLIDELLERSVEQWPIRIVRGTIKDLICKICRKIY